MCRLTLPVVCARDRVVVAPNNVAAATTAAASFKTRVERSMVPPNLLGCVRLLMDPRGGQARWCLRRRLLASRATAQMNRLDYRCGRTQKHSVEHLGFRPGFVPQ